MPSKRHGLFPRGKPLGVRTAMAICHLLVASGMTRNVRHAINGSNRITVPIPTQTMLKDDGGEHDL